MNERINELAEQATTIEYGADRCFFLLLDKEKFAELIVMECTKILADNSEFRGCVIIVKHFGVEE